MQTSRVRPKAPGRCQARRTTGSQQGPSNRRVRELDPTLRLDVAWRPAPGGPVCLQRIMHARPRSRGNWEGRSTAGRRASGIDASRRPAATLQPWPAGRQCEGSPVRVWPQFSEGPARRVCSRGAKATRARVSGRDAPGRQEGGASDGASRAACPGRASEQQRCCTATSFGTEGEHTLDSSTMCGAAKIKEAIARGGRAPQRAGGGRNRIGIASYRPFCDRIDQFNA